MAPTPDQITAFAERLALVDMPWPEQVHVIVTQLSDFAEVLRAFQKWQIENAPAWTGPQPVAETTPAVD